MDGGAAQRKEGARQIESEQQIGGLPGNVAVGLSKAESCTFIGDVEPLELPIVHGDVLNVHALTDGTPKVEPGQSFAPPQGAVPIAVYPADRFVDEGGQHIEIVFIPNGIARVLAIDVGDGGLPPWAIVAVLDDLAEQEIGVVVAFSGSFCELTRAAQQCGYPWNGVGPEQCQLQ